MRRSDLRCTRSRRFCYNHTAISARRPCMPQISAAEFYAQPLRVHTFLAGVPLHDVWAVALPRARERVTLSESNPMERRDRGNGRFPAPVRALFRLRFFLG